MQFTSLGKNVEILKEYLAKSTIEFCDLSIGVRYMWGEEYEIEYAVIDNTLIMKESAENYKDVFYYPIGKNVDGALIEIEKYCREKSLPLAFCCIDDKTAKSLENRYHQVEVYHEREWDDYIYLAENFKTYKGKKLSGQRNHVNKFKKNYPNYTFNKIEEKDIPLILDFLDQYKRVKNLTEDALEEVEMCKDLLSNMVRLNQVGGYLKVDGKIVAVSIGEVLNNTLIVHVEKALTEYQGAYPTMAKEFALAFANDSVTLINREEDCGDEGLRISKTQYHPLEIRAKNCVTVKTLFDKITLPVKIQTERLVLSEIVESDKENYFKLYTDQKLNEFWGYDYKEDLGDNELTPDYFYNFQKELKENKEELSLSVKKDGVMIGEVVLHNFDYYGGVEIGFRLFSEHHKKGYAFESVSALINYAIGVLGAKKIKCKCYKENVRSKALIEKLCLKQTFVDNKYLYFEKQI